MDEIIFEKTLGYGASGIVKKARIGSKRVAVKIIDMSKTSLRAVKQEIKIHRMLNHKNIIKLFATRVYLKDENYQPNSDEDKKSNDRQQIDNSNQQISNPDKQTANPNQQIDNPNQQTANPNQQIDNPNQQIKPNQQTANPNQQINNLRGNNQQMSNLKINKDHSHTIDLKNLQLYNYYLVMELADNELFYFIEPGIGIENVHFYFKQLMEAVFYLHSKNVCHRDIKPENILLDKNCNLLLTDFGHSTLIRDREGKERVLTRIAGSRAYMAPEIFSGSYKGDEVDIWSSGIVLFVLSTGKLPWQDPNYQDGEFEAFFTLSRHNFSPWSELDGKVLKLFEGMCALKNRFKKADIINNEWFRQESSKTKLFKHKVISFSQPKQHISSPTDNFISSQPNPQKFRRVYVSDSEARVFLNIQAILQKMVVKFNASKDNNFLVSYDTIDRRGQPLVGEFCIKRIDDVVSVSINRLRGDSLEFKRFCNAVFESLRKCE